MDVHYEAYESRAGGYGYVDRRDAEGGTTVLGADGTLDIGQATKVAELLNEAMAPEPGMGRIDVSPVQAAYLSSLLRAARANGTLEYEGGDLDEDAFEDLARNVDLAGDEARSAAMDGPGPAP